MLIVVNESHFEESLPFFIIPALISLFASIALLSSGFYFNSQENKAIIELKSRLLTWHYDATQWNYYLQRKAEFVKKLTDKIFMQLVYSLSASLLIIGIYLLLDESDIDLVIWLGLIFIVFLGFAKLVFYFRFRRIRNSLSNKADFEIIVTKKGYFIDGKLQENWRGFGITLLDGEIARNEFGYDEMIIHYTSVIGGRMKQDHYALIPVPNGKKEEAIIALNQILKKK